MMGAMQEKIRTYFIENMTDKHISEGGTRKHINITRRRKFHAEKISRI